MQIFWALQLDPMTPGHGLRDDVNELLISLADELRKSTARKPPSWLQLVLDRLHGEYRRPPAVRELARTAAVDPCHLARTFRRYRMCTIGQYVRQLRLEDALRRMLGCDHRLAEIAAATGFADQAHFTRTFKQELGVTPRDYRRRLREHQSTSLKPAVAVRS
jgi:AraC family transcriptional regulator